MNTLALITVADQHNAAKPVEFDGIRIIGLCTNLSLPSFKPLEFETFSVLDGHICTLLAEPNLKRLKA